MAEPYQALTHYTDAIAFSSVIARAGGGGGGGGVSQYKDAVLSV